MIIKETTPFEYLKRIIQSLGLNNIEYYVMGGSVSATYELNTAGYKDIDLFFPNEEEYEKAYNILTEIDRNNFTPDVDFSDMLSLYPAKIAVYQGPFTTKNADTFSNVIANMDVQLIKRFGTMREQLDRFDLNKSKIALYEGRIYRHESYDLPLHISGIINSDTLRRYMKYSARGYELDNDRFSEKIIEIWNDDVTMYISMYGAPSEDEPKKISGKTMVQSLFYPGQSEFFKCTLSSLINTLNFIADEGTLTSKYVELFILYVNYSEYDIFEETDIYRIACFLAPNNRGSYYADLVTEKYPEYLIGNNEQKRVI